MQCTLNLPAGMLYQVVDSGLGLSKSPGFRADSALTRCGAQFPYLQNKDIGLNKSFFMCGPRQDQLGIC